MQAYGKNFAKIYNLRWGEFANRIAPLILDCYERTPIRRQAKTILDLCCGTGQLAIHFLDRGYRVVGLDLSDHMLQHARQNTADYIVSGQAKFVQGDAADFYLDERFGLVVSTFDALNHLDSLQALRKCFKCVFTVLEDPGIFIFDLNTRLGLMRWNSIAVEDADPDTLIITRGIYDGESERAWTKVSGFIRTEGNLYERFEETAYNTVFELDFVREALLEIGWRKVHFARAQALDTPLKNPEEEGRVFVVAQK